MCNEMKPLGELNEENTLSVYQLAWQQSTAPCVNQLFVDTLKHTEINIQLTLGQAFAFRNRSWLMFRSSEGLIKSPLFTVPPPTEIVCIGLRYFLWIVNNCQFEVLAVTH